ncbi:hypothetical protein H6G97_08250 [Nostoc flagelliforme FACHB-838]|uniref:PEP-CTERM protein-sorting domain-containing protein n=1 Tax=Nostoc flagelliforme FACHB-838 TaxID=2692904 RepID=A0ABR8DKN0_9NOSO|nr:hypothetical protein [Nostoc flagelliforme]MBD2529563.1 hypothetical protein [Nostoc flagelliforme FACHB-838]
MNSKFAKLLFPTVAGTVIGFSTILASFGTAFALQSTVITSPVKQAISNVVLYLQDSSGSFIKVKIDNFSALPETKTYNPTSVLQKYPSYTLVAYTVKAGNNKGSGMGSGEGELVIIGSGIKQSQLPTYNTSDANTYQYKAVYSSSTVSSSTTNTNTTSTSPAFSSDTTTSNSSTDKVSTSTNTVSPETSASIQTSTVSESTVVSSETGGNTQSPPANESPFISSNNAQTTKPVSVPEPGTITAIALFGLGGLFTKKKLTSSSK